jgi:hypothetical protein
MTRSTDDSSLNATPRTDAAAIPFVLDGKTVSTNVYYVPAEFAQGLERELNFAKYSIATLKKTVGL